MIEFFDQDALPVSTSHGIEVALEVVEVPAFKETEPDYQRGKIIVPAAAIGTGILALSTYGHLSLEVAAGLWVAGSIPFGYGANKLGAYFEDKVYQKYNQNQ